MNATLDGIEMREDVVLPIVEDAPSFTGDETLASMILVFKNTLDWMTLPEDVSACASLSL